MFHLFQQSQIAFLVLLALTAVVGAQNLNPTGEGCVDPTGFLGCYSTLQSTFDTCVLSFCLQFQGDTDEYDDCVLECGYAQLAGNIGCWIQSCWNELYSCEYQGTCIQYLNNVEGGLLQNTVYIPFYPPPENAPASCSCNIGEVYGNITAVAIENENVCDNGSQEYFANCLCCQASQILSNVFDLCPSSDLSYVMNVAAEIQDYQDIVSYSADKCAILNTNPEVCQTTYGFSIGGNQKWLNPFNLPGGGIPGTQPLSDGPGTITAVTPATIVLELFLAGTTTIIPVNNPANNARRDIAPTPPSKSASTKTYGQPSPTLHTATIATPTIISPPYTSLSTVKRPPNASTLSCPTKTLYTVPASCPPNPSPTNHCPIPACIAERTLEIPCDCPTKTVYTDYIPLACPTGCVVGCGSAYITVEATCTTSSNSIPTQI